MILLDAHALVALMAEEPAAPQVEKVLRGERPVGILAVNLAEALDVLMRGTGIGDAELEALVGPILQETVTVLAADGAMAWRAANLRRRHYRKRVSELSLADCFLLAAAAEGDTVATGDGPVLRAAGREGIGVVDLT